MTQQKSVLSGIGMMAILTVVSKLVRLIVLMVTARFLTAEDFGIVATFSMVLAIAYMFADLGLIKTIIQRPNINEKHIGGAIIISIIFSAIVFLTLIFASHSIENITAVSGVAQPLQMASSLFVLLAMSNICSAVFQRNGDVVFIGKVQSLSTVFGSLCITVPLLWFDLSYWAIIIGTLVTESISLLLILWNGKSFLKFSFAKAETLEIIKYSSAFFSHNIINLVSKQIDTALVGRYLGKNDLGNYSRSMQLIEFPSQLYWMVVDRVIFPSMSAMKNNKDKLTLFFIDIYSLLLLILSVGALTLFLGATELIPIIMGEGWEVVIGLIEILTISIVFKCLTGFTDSFLAAHGVIKALTYKNIFSLLIFSASIFIGIDFELSGIAYAVVFANACSLAISTCIAIYCAGLTINGFIHASIPAFSTSLFVIFSYTALSFISNFSSLVCILASIFTWALFSFLFPSAIFLSKNGEKFLSSIKYKAINSHANK